MAGKKLIVISGGASGIGLALAKEYLARGARVAAIDLDGHKLGELRSELGPDFFPLVGDISRQADVIRAAEVIREQCGKPEVWINNAGISGVGAFDEISDDRFSRVFEVCFWGVVYGTRAALSLMREPERGSIVNVASLSGLVASPFMSAYASAKHAVVGFTRSLHVEKIQQQSPVNIVLVCPGFARTAIMEGNTGFTFPKWLEWMIETPEQVAREIADGVTRGDSEITPTRHGRWIRRMERVWQGSAAVSSRALTARNWKELLGLDAVRRT